MFFSECLNDMDCSAVDNKNTCKENVCQCNGGYIPDKDACKPCKENEISVQNPESLTFSCVACPTGEVPANDRQHCEGMLNNISLLDLDLKLTNQVLKRQNWLFF